MNITFSGLEGFANELIFLISRGERETITEIEREISENNIMQYIDNKYEDYMGGNFGVHGPYDLVSLNKDIKEALELDTAHFPREYGEDNGLLLLLFIIISLLKDLR